MPLPRSKRISALVISLRLLIKSLKARSRKVRRRTMVGTQFSRVACKTPVFLEKIAAQAMRIESTTTKYEVFLKESNIRMIE
jgi:hypothetical protein